MNIHEGKGLLTGFMTRISGRITEKIDDFISKIN